MYYVKRILFGVTPRSLYTLGSVNWGTTFPATTLIAVIAIAYMVISPIINGLAMASFVLFYYLYRYLFVWSLEQPKDMETGGLFFPRAISHLCVGMYIQQICLGTLFFLARDSDNKASAIPQGALMIVLIAFTVRLFPICSFFLASQGKKNLYLSSTFTFTGILQHQPRQLIRPAHQKPPS